MGTKNNPGTYDCYHEAEPDEPYFVLLARDASAPQMIRNWAWLRDRAITLGVKPESDKAMVAEAMTIAEAMEEWRKENRRT